MNLKIRGFGLKIGGKFVDSVLKRMYNKLGQKRVPIVQYTQKAMLYIRGVYYGQEFTSSYGSVGSNKTVI